MPLPRFRPAVYGGLEGDMQSRASCSGVIKTGLTLMLLLGCSPKAPSPPASPSNGAVNAPAILPADLEVIQARIQDASSIHFEVSVGRNEFYKCRLISSEDKEAFAHWFRQAKVHDNSEKISTNGEIRLVGADGQEERWATIDFSDGEWGLIQIKSHYWRGLSGQAFRALLSRWPTDPP